MQPDRKANETKALVGPVVARACSPDERRATPRSHSEIEVLVAWSHAPRTPVRYRAIDVGAGGLRIRSMLPIVEGLIGTVLSTMPHGALLNRSFQTMWCRKVASDDGSGVAYEAGLRFDM